MQKYEFIYDMQNLLSIFIFFLSFRPVVKISNERAAAVLIVNNFIHHRRRLQLRSLLRIRPNPFRVLCVV